MSPDLSASERSSSAAPPEAAASLIRAEGSVPFAEWLELSWFYPEGFKKERIIETERSWVVLGEQIVYKFLKVSEEPTGEPGEFFARRWQLACEEILDHRSLAGDLYLGLRLLRWVDDEPHWISETPFVDLNPLRPPVLADDVAIVMRRVRDEETLSELLVRQRGISHSQLGRLCESFRRFQDQGRSSTADHSEIHPKSYSRLVREAFVRPLESFVLTDGSFLDPFSQLAFREVRAYLSRFLEKHENLFVERVRSGAVIDSHGSLRADRIELPARGGNHAIAFRGRLPRFDPGRTADYLADIAALSADLEARGFPFIARELENTLLPEHETCPPELYRFYRTADCARRAQLLFTGKVSDAKVSATSFLSLALRSALDLQGAFLVVVGGNDPTHEQRLLRSIVELGGGSVLSLEQCASAAELTDDMRLVGLLRHAERKLLKGQPVALAWPLNRHEERLSIARFSESLGLPFVFALCESTSHYGRSKESDSPASMRRISSPPSKWSNTADLSDVPHLFLERNMSQPELALAVLRQLSLFHSLRLSACPPAKK